MMGISARMAALAVVIVMARLSTSSALPLANSVSKAKEQMRALATTSASDRVCASELAACGDSTTCYACLGEADLSCTAPTLCSDASEYFCCVVSEDCYDEPLIVAYMECLFEEEQGCTVSDLSCSSSSSTGGASSSNETADSSIMIDSSLEATDTSSGSAGIVAEGVSKREYAFTAALGATAVATVEYLL